MIISGNRKYTKNYAGTIEQNTYTYDEWGKDTGKSETVTNPLRYTGYWYD